MTLFSRIFGQKKPQASPKSDAPKGFKVVPPPKNAEQRKLAEGQDITATGGCRSARHQHA